MKTPAVLLLAAALLGGPVLFAAIGSAEAVPDSFGISLVPNAFSRNPRLTMTVFTDMTERGRELRVPTPAAPVYFVAVDQGLRSEGEQLGGVRSPTPAAVKDILFQSLGAAGYQPAPAGAPAGLVLVYYWGSHYAMDPDQAYLFPEVHAQRVMERAMLVGGRAFREKVRDEYEFGYTFADRTPRKLFLINQANDDLNFVVVSAYIGSELAAGRRVLAWRTSMTVSTIGVSMRDSLPPLIVTAGDYFGRETAEPVAIHRRVRRGTVTLGPLTIVADTVTRRK